MSTDKRLNNQKIIEDFKEVFSQDNKYKMNNNNIKVLIKNIIEIFQERCTKIFYPKWRGNEGDTKVFVLKLDERLLSKYGKKRENIITVRLRTQQLDIEVFSGLYSNGKEFHYDSNAKDSDLLKLYKDINDLFVSQIVS
ncbi:hypothetical protein [Clostridium tagluense]|uniref:Uncharacterized protein n=1 Tax=Clostridium tagluense TaxID=360422 RepID=A0A401UQ23_9CLOT|nr:hypothetical protein [Clostridium tagluense]GCD11653.1 hypothetical protein Ctaglu_32760 [Clostridium tagluense]